MAALDPDRQSIVPTEAGAVPASIPPHPGGGIDGNPPAAPPDLASGDSGGPPIRVTPQNESAPRARKLPRARPIAREKSVGQRKSAGQDRSAPPAAPIPKKSVPNAPVSTAPGTIPAEKPQDDAKAEEESQEKLGVLAARYSPPWLVSAVFHMAVLIVLALMLLPSIGRNRINLTATYAEQLGDQLEFDSPFAGNDETLIEEPIFTPDDLEWVDNPFAAPPDVDVFFPHATSAVSDVNAARIGMALNGRNEGTRESLLADYGGGATTEAAVKLGLAWLAKFQKSNGSWSLSGSYPDGSRDENTQAATAMALLAFQGHGNTHKQGKYAKEVARAWKWLLKEQGEDGSFFQKGYYAHRFYTQGMCTIAVCELYGMSREESFKEPAERAIGYCLRNQGSEGGWRYYPQQDDGDVSVTGWILMALQSARMAGLKIPPDHFRRAGKFLDLVAVDGGSRYRYQQDMRPSRAMTAEGLLCRQYLGWEQDDPRLLEGAEWLTLEENLIDYRNDRDVYYWYYATQVMHHMEGDYWERWNKVMRQALPTEQVKSGRQAGSWDPNKPRRDEWGDHGGRLFVTCLSIYMLEVYYRHLPLYSSPYITNFKDR